MKTQELKAIIKAAEDLGHRDIDLMIDDSRDGNDSYPLANARLLKTGNAPDEFVAIVFGYAND